MSNQTSSPTASDIRTRMMNRGPGRPAKIETAHDPRQAMLRLTLYLKPYKSSLMIVAWSACCSTPCWVWSALT